MSETTGSSAGGATRTIEVDYLARVEGEGALYLRTEGERVTDIQFKIFEPPRFFEAFLRGRHYEEAPDITARICGICPVAYQMSAVTALENALGIRVEGTLRALRRLLYCGEWIESHALHVYMLHAPDFLGFEDAIAMAREHPGVLERGLSLKQVGNAIGQLLGGREIHPINVRVGGFYKVPDRHAMAALEPRLAAALDAAVATVEWVRGFPFPDFERDYEFVALRHPDEYPFTAGRLVSNRGLDIALADYRAHFTEEHVAHSHALHAHLIERAAAGERGHYLVGPLARYNLNHDRLGPEASAAAANAGLGARCTNPFKSILVRAVELVQVCAEALAIVRAYAPPAQSFVEHAVRAGIGHGCTEAPRGILYHRYEIDADGLIVDAQITPPTSQNQATIEDDLRDFVPRHLALDDASLRWKCEQAIRNYDPCISCATHFLKFDHVRA